MTMQWSWTGDTGSYKWTADTPGANGAGASFGGGSGSALGWLGMMVQMYGQGLATQAEVKELEYSEEDAIRAAKQMAKARDWRVRMIHEAAVEMGGEIEAETGKSGLAMSGTPLEYRRRQALAAELTASMAYEAGTYEVESWFRQAAAFSRGARNRQQAGDIQQVGTLIGGIGDLAMGGGIGA